ncbi:MAG: hypothetical protein J5528_05940 [Firmicutes bacterium]|nr:hypothetical protein [Bacillota bacterium]
MKTTKLTKHKENSDINDFDFEELPAGKQELAFEHLKQKLSNEIHLDTFNIDTLKALGLYTSEQGFNKAAELFADTNSFCGIDIIRFGANIVAASL